MLDQILSKIRSQIPSKVFSFFQPAYHYFFSITGAILYRFPSRQIKIIAVTGTKGKSSTTEIANAILEEAGYKTALSNTIRFKIADNSEDNMYKMSMPGRFFVQRFIRKAVKAKCDYIVLEMTSQGTMQYRHKFLDLNALVFTNLSPEHIESHGSYENYVQAKLEIAKELSRSAKRPRIMVVNGDDKENLKFLAFDSEVKKSFTIKDKIPETQLIGEFNKYNVLAAVTLARCLSINEEIIKKAVANFKGIPGRVQFIDCGQDFQVVVDYAHTADSMEKLYKAFDKNRKICVFGATGGGRDKWKREEMGKIADTYCDEIILTDDDSYDEDTSKILEDVARGIKNKVPSIIVDRRQAITEAMKKTQSGDIVLITGKGTDPYLMGPNGTKTPWSDAKIAKEILEKLGSTR